MCLEYRLLNFQASDIGYCLLFYKLLLYEDIFQ
jgi:hypothetical protein